MIVSNILDFALIAGFWTMVIAAICPIAWLLERYMPELADEAHGDDNRA